MQSDRFQEGPLLSDDDAVVDCETEIIPGFHVCLQFRAIGLIGCEAVETDEAPGDVIRPFVRQEVTDELAAAAGDDASPGLRVLAEVLEFERVDLIADETGDFHGLSRWGPDGCVCHSAP